jgi:hypothetical protein
LIGLSLSFIAGSFLSSPPARLYFGIGLDAHEVNMLSVFTAATSALFDLKVRIQANIAVKNMTGKFRVQPR